jgi:peptidoglycan-associated lipoprotein
LRLLETIYFEYDADELRDDARASLDAKIAILNANPALRVRVAGHCDERGSDEYNIALGRRRAEAAKRYLTDRGIDASRIETSSFGRERPAVQGTTEEAWSKNRRDEFEITAGGENLKPAS